MFHDIIHSFYLAIGFWVINGGKFGIYAKHLAKMLLYIKRELGASIKDKEFRETMMFPNVSIKQLRCFFGFHDNGED